MHAANDAYSPDAASGQFSSSFTLNTTTPTPGGASSPASGDILYFGAVTTGMTAVNNNLTGFTFGFNFLSGASAYTISGNAFTLSGGITNNSASAQTFSNDITLASNQTVSANTGNVTLSGVVSGTGTLTVVPEPSTWAMLLMGAGLLGWKGRQRLGALARRKTA